MAQQPVSKGHLDRFCAQREDAKGVLASRLVIDAREVRKLDEHLQSFLTQIKKDAKEHEVAPLRKHAAAFEKEVQEELDLLYGRVEQDMLLLQRTLHALVTYRTQLREALDDQELSNLARSEINYADLLVKTALEKIHTLALLSAKLKK